MQTKKLDTAAALLTPWMHSILMESYQLWVNTFF